VITKLTTIMAVLILFAVLGAEAQQTTRSPRIAMLMLGSPETTGHLIEAFRQGLRDLGYIEGQNVRYESRWAMGKPEQLPQFARELVALAHGEGWLLEVLSANHLREQGKVAFVTFGTMFDPAKFDVIAFDGPRRRVQWKMKWPSAQRRERKVRRLTTG